MTRLPPLLITGLLLGCAKAEETPLGGPYGGNAFATLPNEGGINDPDATFTPPRPPSDAAVPGEYATWTHIFFAYLAEGTIGNCTPCHREMSDPPSSFRWLEEQGYVGEADPTLTTEQRSCLTWYGGNMPPGTPELSEEAVAEMNDWVKAGARNN
jgi:hypothetical protein